ncbi:MAG: T9SS type A sorting domain-containing protein [Flavobacteriales bacterium]
MRCLFILLLIFSVQMKMFGQSEDLINAPLFNVTCITSFAISGCGTSTYNLGASTSLQLPSFGTMANDVWWRFEAPGELVKLKVCEPSFDAAIEVWANADSMVSSVNLNSNTGLSGKEFFCVGGLHTGTFYYVRIGRVSGSGPGTFGLKIEHNRVVVSPNYTPSPPGQSCYRPGLNIKRTNTCATPLGSTRWKFVDEFGNETICVGVGDQPISNCGEFCLDGSTYTVFVEVRANDAECGNIFWGYGPGKPMQMCSNICLTMITPTNNQVINNFQNFTFSAAGSVGYEYNWRFTTDGGTTQFCTGWLTTPNFSPFTLSNISNCLSYNKIYQLQLKVRYCESETESDWCAPISFITPPFPYVNVNADYCCKWRNINSGTLYANAVLGIDQYQWRFTPINDAICPPDLTPIGIPVFTSWSSLSYVNPNGIPGLIAGTTYNVQVKGRTNAFNCTLCSGTNQINNEQLSEWGPSCIIPFRTTGDPSPGTFFECCAGFNGGNGDANMIGTESESLQYSDLQYSNHSNFGILEIRTMNQNSISVLFSETQLSGDGILRIYSLNGAIVYEQLVHEIQLNTTFTIDLKESISTGMYIVSVVTDSGAVSDKIMIGQD